MSQSEFLGFVRSLRTDRGRLERYDGYSLSQLLFHARNEGRAFTVPDVEAVIGRLESTAIMELDGEPIDGFASLWPEMWGRRHLAYVVDRLLPRFTEAGLDALAAEYEAPLAQAAR